ncbi:hypothetical protein N865_07570 [Intrasporangium oryzae NRRL B-24470]|uniref:Uncharacterized protein n=1 Tax=Intrasporangium oryzae NRRL B-24470 TaxID=1386089 RepID=W9G912_9MICO|nr:hypothetical protein [Intrasporangium oryzae]EWT01747.1 hypothetical protein N865_07570 [Intrasporangium oryzae NRRL B-24470]
MTASPVEELVLDGLVMLDLASMHAGRRVWVFTHQAVIMGFRLVLEGLDERRLLEVDRNEPLGSSVTRYRRGADGTLQLVSFADTGHLEESEVTETHENTDEPDALPPREPDAAPQVAQAGPIGANAERRG